jgi:hypothetical protein
MSSASVGQRFLRRNRGRLIALGLLVLAFGLWQLYVHANDDGLLVGRVVDEQGDPVPGATVVIAEKTLELLKNQRSTTTDASGTFRFEGLEMVEFVVQAQKSGYEPTPSRSYHLYFRSQNFELPEPLVLRPVSEPSAPE